ncbi:zincin-like metallopeptidase domain-containing protein [Paenibacillus polymyxa]|uniref:ArdC family protein n=1 Tax=Paenibacillus polymyxa TaxID=1406 RepID=UPI002AB37914|nr:zincin-like metallopeptidase domain-containing protein [Paenibacillus polymyxa]MDY8049434.1 zincin-like metallopeptidase domain-containing protein [Paenibacillus polymyxa]
MKNEVYELVTKRILDMLAAGVAPWRQPWVVGGAVNWKTQKPYRGINAMLLDSGEYATFKQIKESGGRVKRGEKAQTVVFWKWLELKDKDSTEDEPKKIAYLRKSAVFNIQTQCEGLQSKRQELTFQHDPIAAAEAIINGYVGGPPTSFASGRAFYRPSTDSISVPPLQDYPKAEDYYNVRFHEMTHSTGHRERLNRPGIEQFGEFGDHNYTKEELIAEMGAAMLCATCGIDNSTIEDSASYIDNWNRKLKQEPMWIIEAARLAQKAADYILGVTFDEESGGAAQAHREAVAQARA